MADDTTLRGGQDRKRINLQQEHEVRYWSEKFGCTPEELRAAVARAGSSQVERVQQALAKT